MAKRILSPKNVQPRTEASQQSQSNWRTYQGRNGRIAPSMSSSRSEANLPNLRLPDGGQHSTLEHFANGNSNQLNMLKTKVWYHSQRNVQEASV